MIICDGIYIWSIPLGYGFTVAGFLGNDTTRIWDLILQDFVYMMLF